MDSFSEKRMATIRELNSRNIKIKPQEKERPMSTATGYLTLSIMLFAITYTVPILIKVWIVLAGIGLIVGVILLAKKFCEWVRNNPNI